MTAFSAAARGAAAARIVEAALAHHRDGRLAEADRLYGKALAADPAHFSALLNLGLIRIRQGRLEEAVRLLRKAVNQNPNAYEAHGSLGNALLALDRFDEAIERYRRALRLRPDLADAHANMAAALHALGRFDEAEAACAAGLRIEPNQIGAHGNLANVLLALQRPAEAIEHYRHVLRLAPDLVDANWNQSLAWLMLGEYEQGWRQFEWRWKKPNASTRRRPLAAPLWLGEDDLSGRTILLHAEQGLGNSLQFARYVPLVAARGARIILEVQRPLVTVLGQLARAGDSYAEGEELPPFDCHCPLMSLPLAFGTTLDTIPAQMPYLAPDGDLARTWRDRVAVLPGLKVGLVWSGSPRPLQPGAAAIDRRRSMALSQFARLSAVAGVSLVSVQKGEAAAQALTPTPGLALHDWTDSLHDFADTAALIQALDLVISVDTSVVHLAGALAKPVWLLNRFDTCWRWLLGRDDSPWYPTLRQFRQPRPGDWDSVMAEVTRALAGLASQARG